MGIRLEGFDELKRKLNDLATRAERLHGEYEIHHGQGQRREIRLLL